MDRPPHATPTMSHRSGSLAPSSGLVRAWPDVFPGSTHVRDVGLSRATDEALWTYTAQHGHVIVFKDTEFHQRGFLLGQPPKVVWIRRGSCSTGDIEKLLRQRHPDLLAFDADPSSRSSRSPESWGIVGGGYST
jgi:predicted nuclease of predicted toxin-antitoxin system